MMLLSRGWRLLRYSFFTSISFRIFSLLVRHSLYFSASLGVGIRLPTGVRAMQPAAACLAHRSQLSRPARTHCRSQESSDTATNKEQLTPKASGGRKEPIRAGKRTGRESGSSALCCALSRGSNRILPQRLALTPASAASSHADGALPTPPSS